MNQKDKGLIRIKEILGNLGEKSIENFNKISPDFTNYILNFAYGDIYTRDGLTDKNRELIVITSLISQGSTGLPVKAHFQGMLNVGWKKNEIIEIIIFLIPCVGFPSAVNALQAAQEVFDKN